MDDVRSTWLAAMRSLAVRQATTVVDVEGGIAVLHADYPVSHEHNRLLLTEPVPWDVAVAEADRVLGGAGLAHRRVDWLGEPAADRPDPLPGGWEVGRTLVMHLPGAVDGASAPLDRVRRLAPDDPLALGPLREAVRAGWLADLPDLGADGADQLADRVRATADACNLTWHVVLDDDHRHLAHGQLRLLEVDGLLVAQVEDVLTEPAHRGQGFARAVVVSAVVAARGAGAGLIGLEADLDDWPRELYARMGFEPLLGPVTTATRAG